jgi:hypothetical protein
VLQTAFAETRIHGSLRWLPLKLADQALAIFLPAFLRASHGHPLLLAMPVLPSHSSHTSPERVLFRRCPPHLSPGRIQSQSETDGKTPQIPWDWQSLSRRVPTLVLGWSPDSRSRRHAAPRVRVCAAARVQLICLPPRQPQPHAELRNICLFSDPNVRCRIHRLPNA